MVAFATERQQLKQGDLVVIECDHQCNIRLVDDDNFTQYKNGERHKYYGGFYRMFPARLVVPRDGYWNVVIDLGGNRAAAKYAINYIRSVAHAVA